MAAELLRLTNLCKSFGRLAAVNGLDLAVSPGEVVGVAGPNGSGKSTLLNLLTGLVRPDWGQIFWAGRDITRLSAQARAGLGFARTFQISRPFWELTVWTQTVLAAAGGAAVQKPAHERRAAELLRTLDLWPQRDFLPERLSAGALRRLEVVRALAREPRLVLLDEPFATLSPREEPLVVSAIADTVRRGAAVLLVSHRSRLLGSLTDRVCLFEPRRKPREITSGRWEAGEE